MTEEIRKPSSLEKLQMVRRRAIPASQEAWISTEEMQPGQTLPLVIRPTQEGIDFVEWAAKHLELVRSLLLKHGGLLFRSFNVGSPEVFERFVHVVCGESLGYRERSSPRSQVSGHIYTSTEHPANQSIFLHNEQSYNNIFPRLISFCCLTPARQGGETPIADCRGVYNRLDTAIVDRFAERHYMYVRNFGDGFGLSWQEAFQTENRSEVEQYCQKNEISFEWKSGGRLRTRQIRRAVARHPSTKEMVWFNHLTFFHVSTLEPEARDAMLAEFNEEDLPNNTYYGDGSPIESWVLEECRKAYQQETITFPWQKGDILVLDNMLTAHGRAPFVGPRKVVVAMSELVQWKEI